MPHLFFARNLWRTAILSSALGCSSTPTGVAALAGRYELRSVDGRPVPVDALGGALGGELRLSSDGTATRVVQYPTSGIPGPIINRATGTYRVRGSRITLTLAEEGRTARLARWQASAEVQLPTLVLRYPGGGERDIEERYVRVAGRGSRVAGRGSRVAQAFRGTASAGDGSPRQPATRHPPPATPPLPSHLFPVPCTSPE